MPASCRALDLPSAGRRAGHDNGRSVHRQPATAFFAVDSFKRRLDSSIRPPGCLRIGHFGSGRISKCLADHSCDSIRRYRRASNRYLEGSGKFTPVQLLASAACLCRRPTRSAHTIALAQGLYRHAASGTLASIHSKEHDTSQADKESGREYARLNDYFGMEKE